MGFSLAGWHSDTPVRKAIAYLRLDFEHGDSPEQISFNNISTLGNEFFVCDSRGFLFLLKDSYPNLTDKIKLNTTVTKINYSESGAEVTTADGLAYTADYVICTFSTGVLGSHMVTFEPPLPRWKMEAVFKLKLAYYTKMFVKFPSKFWDDNEYILFAARNRGRFTVMQNLDKEGLFPGKEVKSLVGVQD